MSTNAPTAGTNAVARAAVVADADRKMIPLSELEAAIRDAQLTPSRPLRLRIILAVLAAAVAAFLAVTTLQTKAPQSPEPVVAPENASSESSLPLATAEALAEALLDFQTVDDLAAWLDARIDPPTT